MFWTNGFGSKAFRPQLGLERNGIQAWQWAASLLGFRKAQIRFSIGLGTKRNWAKVIGLGLEIRLEGYRLGRVNLG